MSDDRLLHIDEVVGIVGLGTTRIRELTMARQFPQPIRFGRAIRYSALEVQDWIRQRKAERDAGLTTSKPSESQS
jgi:predicted DNA-binding transcriptional regulator AlpA